MATPEYIRKWEHILEDVEKSKIPIEFIKKFVCKLDGKRQHTINVDTLIKQGLEPEEIEEVVTRKLNELDEVLLRFEIILNVASVADVVQSATNEILSNAK
jgi:hypothetical protein